MIERLLRFLNGTSFHRGLALGALVGAAIAGSTIWTRVRESRGGAQLTARRGRAVPEVSKPSD